MATKPIEEYALVRGGVIVNVILADADFIAQAGDTAARAHGGGAWLRLEAKHCVKGQRPSTGWKIDAAEKCTPADPTIDLLGAPKVP